MRLERILGAVLAETGADAARVVDGSTGEVVAAVGDRPERDTATLLAPGEGPPKAGDRVVITDGAVHVLRGIAGPFVHLRLGPGADLDAARRRLADPGLHASLRAQIRARQVGIPQPRPAGAAAAATPSTPAPPAAPPAAPVAAPVPPVVSPPAATRRPSSARLAATAVDLSARPAGPPHAVPAALAAAPAVVPAPPAPAPSPLPAVRPLVPRVRAKVPAAPPAAPDGLPALARIGHDGRPRGSFAELAVRALGTDEAARVTATSWSRDAATLRRVLAGLHRL